MQKTSKPTTADGAQPSRGDTVTAQGERQTPTPRMPHERDESTDSQARTTPGQQIMGEMAHDDLAEGQRDTDKGPVLDATYDKVLGRKKV